MTLLGGIASAGLLLAGQATPAPRVDSVPGAELTVYLLTFDPGDLIWERFGHNALVIADAGTGTSWGFDYGRFSFGRTLADRLRFFGRFAAGDLRYSMGDAAAEAYLEGYRRAGRSIWSQELDLAPEARVALRDFLDWNRRPENQEYQYHYYLDNCSTRIRDALDKVVGGQIKAWADTVRTPWTFRDHTRRTTENSPAMYTLLNIGLGHPADRRLNAWEEMFLPISLRPYLAAIAVRDPDGRVHPLVKETRHLVESDRFSVAERPSNWLPRFAALGMVAGIVLVAAGWVAGRFGGRWRFLFVAAGGFWSFAAGLAGLTLMGLWLVSGHQFAGWNENVLQLNIVSLLVAWAMPTGVLGGNPARRGLAMFSSGLALSFSLGGLVAKGLPWFDQGNLDLIALFLPIHLGLFLGFKALRGDFGRSPLIAPGA
ncbi:MAG: DUF4105 domain-containing protein [Gemmatimonadetes bacterium]|nr:DUF4105 domain-containing protein [Gemmatimonadota bacterium]